MPVSAVANSGSFKVTTPSDRVIEFTRLFNASPELLFEAMTRPEHIRNWWGCLSEGFSVPVCEVDLRVGGKWRFVNRMPDGRLAAFNGEYREIDAPGRLVYTEIFEDFPTEASLVTSVIAAEGGKTRLTVSAEYSSNEVRDMVLQTGMEHGAALSYDRLEEVAATLAVR